MPDRHLRSPRWRGVLLAAALVLTLGLPSAQAWDPSKTPARAVPQDRWGALEPKGIAGDRTGFKYHSDPKQNDPFYFAVDIEEGFLFVPTGRGLQIYDTRTNPAEPSLMGYAYGPHPTTQGMGGLMPVWQHSDEDFFLKDIDAPPGVHDVVAVAAEAQGFLVWNTSNKTSPTVHYQDEGILPTAVYSASIGGNLYSFAATDRGVYVYDLTAAKRHARCLDTSPALMPCTGVYKGKAGAIGGSTTIDGVGNFLAVGRYDAGFEIWNVSNPTAPVRVMTGGGAAIGVAMWQVGSSYYLASAQYGKLRIYNVSCIASGACNPPAALAALDVPNGTPPLSNVTFSWSNSTPFLHVGGDDTFSCSAQREYLFNVSNPASPEDVTPKTHPGGYWGWYYEGCSPGMNWVSPRMGKFYGDHFYRAAYSILDVHKLVGAQAPAANFSWSPAEVYPDTPVTFNDASTGQPTQWTWSFNGGTPAASGSQNPAVTFSTPGAKTVGLTVGRDGFASPVVEKTVNVIDPAPKVVDVTVSPASPKVCQPITFTATGVTGKPALGFAWKVEDGGGAPVAGATGAANPFVWTPAANTAAGNFTATVTVSNGAGNASKSKVIAVAGLTPLPADNQFTPTNAAFTAGTVQFSLPASADGATEWSWDFDDDANPATESFGAWTSDPVAGPNPVHSYITTGARQVRVKVRSCLNPNGAVSAPLAVTIVQITPLEASFTLMGGPGLCIGGTCYLDAGTAYTFMDSSTGAETWSFDWNGDGDYADPEEGPRTALDTSSGPRTVKHTYTTPTQGEFTPRLKVQRGSESKETLLANALKVGAAVPPTLTINGASSTDVNKALAFVAEGGGSCNVSAAGWSWNGGGGTVTGTGASVTIVWSTAGTKTVSVTNSGCPGATGTKSVSVITPGGGGGGGGGGNGGGALAANYTFTPPAPVAGQVVSFNGAGSNGSPEGYVWDFGDGSGFGTGAQTTHVFTQPGNYRVSLSVNKAGNCPPAPFCESTMTKVIVVGTGELPVGAAFNTSASCVNEFGLSVCNARVGETVTFTETSTGNPTAWTWSFSDGGTATGRTATHAFATPGPHTVTLTAARGAATSTASKSFNVSGQPAPTKKTVVLPWIAQTRGVLVQSSDLYVHNPGKTEMEVKLEFRKRGLLEEKPPTATRKIAPGATLYVEDVIRDLFLWENMTGFVAVTTEAGAEPVITSFNTTFQADGSEFGQTVPGISMSRSGTAAATTGQRMQYLVGLNDNSDRQSYFGIGNPNNEQVTYKLRFFDKLGRPLGKESADLTLGRFGLKQFQTAEIRSTFGISEQEDFRVEVETKSGGQILPYGTNIRVASKDPSYLAVGSSSASSKAYLVGAMSTPGLNKSVWQSDLVLSNTTDQVILTDISFTPVGVLSTPTGKVRLTLQPGETQRVEDVVNRNWSIRDAVGVLTIESDSPNKVYPIVQGESYENTRPEHRFGQFMAAQSDKDAASAGKGQYLVGLRQSDKYRTTVWLFNPSNETGDYDLVYRALDGRELGRIPNIRLNAGRMRQFSPSAHPLPVAGVQDGFTLEVVVRSGKVMTSAQVINNRTNDPAYIQGQTQ